MFQFDATTSEETSAGKFVSPGIQDNLTLKSIEWLDDAGNGDPALDITFQDTEGKTVNRRFFDPSKSQFDPQKAVNKFNKVAKNIATKFLGENAALSGTDYKSFCKDFIAQLTPHFGSDTKLRVKVILNNGDFPTLPGYAPICELMTVPKEQSKLKINPDFKDRITPNEVAPSDTTEGEEDGAPWSMGS